MSFWNFICGKAESGKNKDYNPNREGSIDLPKVRNISDVKTGEKILITYYEYRNDVYTATVVSNNQGRGEIYIKIPVTDNKPLFEVQAYDHYYFRSFSTVNMVTQDKEEKTVAQKLLRILENCEKTEDYESATIIKQTIEKLNHATKTV